MANLSRRQFLKMAAALAATLAWPRSIETVVAEGLHDLAVGTAPLLWLQGQSCSGCSVSLLNATYPDPVHVLTQYISLCFNQTISAATGEMAVSTVNKRMEAGGYVLVVEGAVPQGVPLACRVGEENFTDLLKKAAKNATAIVALGTCASFGGIPAGGSNPTGATSASSYLSTAGISAPIINLPGCPTHPDWLLGTLLRLLRNGLPTLDTMKRPTAFYGSVIHDRCPWFQSYQRGHFAEQFGQPGCLFKLGCLGIRTEADCSVRRWNNKVNWCIEAGAPCTGCARPQFTQQIDFPLYRMNEIND